MEVNLGQATQSHAQANFTSAGGAQNRNHRNDNRAKKGNKGAPYYLKPTTQSGTECWNCKKMGHKSFECTSPRVENEGKRNFETGGFEEGGEKRGRGGRVVDFENNNFQNKKTFPMKSAFKGGKFKGKQGQSGGKYGAKSGGRTNFMDADDSKRSKFERFGNPY